MGVVMKGINKGNANGSYVHGMTYTPTWISWSGMLTRCTNPATNEYKRYGGRGIKVCRRWRSFVNFLADMGERPLGTSLDRIDSNGNYEPENCRWADNRTQQSNRRNTRLIEFEGRTQCIAHWAQEKGLDVRLVWSRLNAGWDIERALTFPIQKNEKGRIVRRDGTRRWPKR